MGKKQVDRPPPDSDLSLDLLDASSLSSGSDLSDPVPSSNKKKPIGRSRKKAAATTVKKTTANKSRNSSNKKKKSTAVTTVEDKSKYCVCRKGYDGKEFMIECDGCQEWFHGACIGLKPNSVTDTSYYCEPCTLKKKQQATPKSASAGKNLLAPRPTTPSSRKKSLIILPLSSTASSHHTPAVAMATTSKSEQPVIIKNEKPKTSSLAAPVIPTPTITQRKQEDDDDEEDLDDICVLCDGDCTCGAEEPFSVQVTATSSNTTIAAATTATPVPILPVATLEEKPKLDIPKKLPTIKIISKKSPPKKPSKKSNKKSSNKHTVDDSSDSDDIIVHKKPPSFANKKKPPQQKQRGKSTALLANMIRQGEKVASKGSDKKKKSSKTVVPIVAVTLEDEEDEELIVDDLDDLLETMSPLSEHSSQHGSDGDSLLESEEFFTDSDDEESDSAASFTSSAHIDSGDDEDIEDAETRAIINEMALDSSCSSSSSSSDGDDEDMEDAESGIFIEDEDDELDEGLTDEMLYQSKYGHWSSSSEEEDEEVEFDYTMVFPATAMSGEEDDDNALHPLLDGEGSFYNSITAAFMQVLATAPTATATTTTTGANTPILNTDYQLSAFELASALGALSQQQQQQQEEILRRPSLPSSAVSAAHRMRGSQDFSTSEALRALSSLVTADDLVTTLSLAAHENETNPVDNNNNTNTNSNTSTSLPAITTTSTSIHNNIAYTTKRPPLLLPKQPSGSVIGSNNAISNQKRQGTVVDVTEDSKKKRRVSRSNSLNSMMESILQPMPSNSFSTPASPAAIIDELEDMIEPSSQQDDEGDPMTAVSMDDLVDTSIYTTTRSPSPDEEEEEEDQYTRDLSRWQRIPIGAFRLMRSKNKLWLER